MKLQSHVAELARERGFLTIGALASAAGLPHSTVARYWGRELPRHIYKSTLEQLCKALDARPADLFLLIEDK